MYKRTALKMWYILMTNMSPFLIDLNFVPMDRVRVHFPGFLEETFIWCPLLYHPLKSFEILVHFQRAQEIIVCFDILLSQIIQFVLVYLLDLIWLQLLKMVLTVTIFLPFSMIIEGRFCEPVLHFVYPELPNSPKVLGVMYTGFRGVAFSCSTIENFLHFEIPPLIMLASGDWHQRANLSPELPHLVPDRGLRIGGGTSSQHEITKLFF